MTAYVIMAHIWCGLYSYGLYIYGRHGDGLAQTWTPLAYLVMAHIGMAHGVMAYTDLAFLIKAYPGMSRIVNVLSSYGLYRHVLFFGLYCHGLDFVGQWSM